MICDKVTALAAAQAITAALFARERTGRGQKVDVAMLDAAIAFNWPEGMYNQAFVDPAPPSPEWSTIGRLWRAIDGHVSCSALQDSEFAAMRRALGNPPELAAPAYATMAGRAVDARTIYQVVAREISRRTCADLMAAFTAEGVVGCVVNSRQAVLSDPQVAHNGCIAIVDQGAAGPVRVARHPVRFSDTPAIAAPGPAPNG